MDYKISAIIPVYNADKTLKKAIESIINQSIGFENIELIIVNDNSKDNSKKIIESYSKKYDNIIGLHLPKNSGLPGKPRNIGIEHATAPYLIFLDADDEYLPHAFELYYNTIENEKSDFVMGSHYWNFKGKKANITILHECDNPSDIININPLLNEKNFRRSSYYHASPWGKIFNKKLINNKNIRFLEEDLCEDAYFYYKTILNSKKITLLPNDILYIYNVYDSNNSTIHTHNIKTFNNFLNGYYKVLSLFDNISYSKENIIRPSINSLLLLFSNLSLKDKKENIPKLYELQESMDEQPILPQKETTLLWNEIQKQHYTRAIIISEFYSFFYNNKTIRTIYRRIRWGLTS